MGRRAGVIAHISNFIDTFTNDLSLDVKHVGYHVLTSATGKNPLLSVAVKDNKSLPNSAVLISRKKYPQEN